MIIGRQEVVLFYEFFYSKKYGNASYKFTPSSKAEETIQHFLKVLDERYKLISLGKSFLSRYFIFQFNRLEGQVFKRFSSKDKAGKIQIYDIIGKKAFEYWLQRDLKFDFVIATPLNLRVSKFEAINHIAISEEIEKKRFHDTSRGFLNCIERTSLFHHKSIHCSLCTFKNDCKKVLKQNYNKIYIDRGYATT